MSSYRFPSNEEEASLIFNAQPPGNDPGGISRSWQRCRMAGLAPEQHRLDARALTPTERRAASAANAAFLAQARPVMEYVYSQIRNSSSMVLLANTQGYLLEAAGDTDFCGRAAKVSLTPGACWAELQRGTNAIGTALAEGKAVVVRGAEHYLRVNSFLACTAAPIIAPTGKMLGVLDISCESRHYHPHTFGLARMAGEIIESRIFEAAHAQHSILRFHTAREYLGTITEGALAFDAQGRITGANRAAFTMLGLTQNDIGQRDAASCFGLSFAGLLALSRGAQGRAVPVQPGRGTVIHMLIEDNNLPQPRRAAPATLPPPAATPFNVFDTSDTALAKSLGQLRRALAHGAPILLQGESGTGKTLFARAIHAAGPRAATAFIAVNCTLPEAKLEAELFGPSATAANSPQAARGALADAGGGTLFLDQIDALPPALQARLLRGLEETAQPAPLDITLICATRDDLAASCAAGTFLNSLYYRLNGLTLTLPPLRERSDMTAIAERIIVQECQGRATMPRLSPELAAAFAQFGWPGNLRQLAGWLRTACLMLDDEEEQIMLSHLSPEAQRSLTAQPATQPAAITASLRSQSDAAIASAITQAGGNIAAAARQLGISRNTLYRRLAAMRGEDQSPGHKKTRI